MNSASSQRLSIDDGGEQDVTKCRSVTAASVAFPTKYPEPLSLFTLALLPGYLESTKLWLHIMPCISFPLKGTDFGDLNLGSVKHEGRLDHPLLGPTTTIPQQGHLVSQVDVFMFVTTSQTPSGSCQTMLRPHTRHLRKTNAISSLHWDMATDRPPSLLILVMARLEPADSSILPPPPPLRGPLHFSSSRPIP